MAGGGRVCVVGSLHVDIMVRTPYLPRLGETLIGQAWWWKVGGKGANQAVAAARHGAAVELVGCLGEDDFGTRLRERLAGEGVGLGHVATVPGGSGMSVAVQEAGGDYAAIVVSGADGALDPTRIEGSASAIREAPVLLLQQEVGEPANVAAARLARTAGAKVVLNAAPARSPAALADLVDVLVVNGIEAEMLGAAPVVDLPGAADATRALASLAPTVVVTAGAAGVAWADRGEVATFAAHQVPRARTHGAGDVFVGALGARLAAAVPLPEALRYANAAAALHVGAPEADARASSPEDVWRLLSGSLVG